MRVPLRIAPENSAASEQSLSQTPSLRSSCAAPSSATEENRSLIEIARTERIGSSLRRTASAERALILSVNSRASVISINGE